MYMNGNNGPRHVALKVRREKISLSAVMDRGERARNLNRNVTYAVGRGDGHVGRESERNERQCMSIAT